jgi:cellobiose phosphorylase
MFLAVSQYIFGIRPDYNGVFIDPCIPDSWGSIDIERVVRGVKLKVKVKKDNLIEGDDIGGTIPLLINKIQEKNRTIDIM